MSDPTLNAGGALHNRLGIEDPKVLQEVETVVAMNAAVSLTLAPVQGNFDREHLAKIHERLFGQVYEWAGQTRPINFSKTTPDRLYRTRFEQIDNIPNAWGQLEARIENFLQRDKGHFASDLKELGTIYAKLNHIHPFREGNGRATQLFMRQLAQERDIELDFSKVNKQDFNFAAMKAVPHQRLYEHGRVSVDQAADPEPMSQVLRSIASPRQRGKEAPYGPTERQGMAPPFAASQEQKEAFKAVQDAARSGQLQLAMKAKGWPGEKIKQLTDLVNPQRSNDRGLSR